VILVTGSAGFVGKRLVRLLLESGLHVRATDVADSGPPGCEYLRADLTDLDQVRPLMRGVEAVCHLAAIREPRPRQEWPEVMRVNCLSTYHILDAAQERNIPKVAVASSICAGGWLGGVETIKPLYYPIDESHPCQPEEAYSLTKLVNEETASAFAVRFQMQVVCLRLCNVADAQQRGGALPPCSILWTMVDVGDVASAFHLAVTADCPGFHVFHIGSRFRYLDDGSRESGQQVIEQVHKAGIREIRDLDWAINGGPIHSSRAAMQTLRYDPKF